MAKRIFFQRVFRLLRLGERNRRTGVVFKRSSGLIDANERQEKDVIKGYWLLATRYLLITTHHRFHLCLIR